MTILCLKSGHTYYANTPEVAERLIAAGKDNVEATDDQKATAMRLLSEGYAAASLIYEATEVDSKMPILGQPIPVEAVTNDKDYVVFLPMGGG